MSLTDALVYAPKPSAVSGQKHRQTIPPYNKSTFSPGETIMLNIPTGRQGQFLNQRQSFLSFKLSNLETEVGKTLTLDYSGACLFSSLRVYHGSNLLESIEEYNVLYTLWHDMVGSSEAMKHTGNLLEGTHNTDERTGAVLLPQGGDVLVMPILSGIIGTLQSKYLPVGDMSAGDIRVELTLANAADGVVAAAARKWSVSDVNLQLEYVELNSEAARMISQQNAGGYVISGDSFANYANTVPSGVSNGNVLIPARFSSLKTLFTVFRKQGNIGNSSAKTVSERYNPLNSATAQAYYSIGGRNLPSTPMSSPTEMAAEVSKALHAFGTVDSNSMLTRGKYGSTDGAFVLAQDLETSSHKSRVSEKGINTLSTNTHLVTQFGLSLPAALRVDTFAHYDFVLLIQNGQATVRF